jgi:hypothetical protein
MKNIAKLTLLLLFNLPLQHVKSQSYKTNSDTVSIPSNALYPESTRPIKHHKSFRHAIDICPLSPFMRIYAFQYSYAFNEKDYLMLGLAMPTSYMIKAKATLPH